MASVSISPTTVAPGGTQQITVSGLAPGEWVTGFYTVPESPAIPIPVTQNGTLHTANNSGVATWSWTYLNNIPTGSYTLHFLEESGEQFFTTVQVNTGIGISGSKFVLLGLGLLALVALGRRR